MNQDELLANALLSAGRIDQNKLTAIWQTLAGQPEGSLGLYLVRLGDLTPAELSEFNRSLSGRYAHPAGHSAAPTPVTPHLQRGSSQHLISPTTSPHSSSFNAVRQSSGNLLVPGAFVGPYQVVEEISRGAMGVVYQVKAPDGKICALKMMLGSGQSEQLANRFKREAKVLAQLSHPAIVKILDHGVIHENPWLVMSYVKGPTLQEYVKGIVKTSGQALSIDEALELMESLAKALAYCHELGVIHRDLKPNNIVIDERTKRPVLLDFGLVRAEQDGAEVDGLSQALSVTGELLGTPSFMSPEQFDSSEVRSSADVWSFGAILFFVLTGGRPFIGNSMAEIHAAVVGQDIPRPSSIRRGLPRFFDDLCSATMNRDSDKRLSMREIENQISLFEYKSTSGKGHLILKGSVLCGIISLMIAGIFMGIPNSQKIPVIHVPSSNLVFSKSEFEISGTVENMTSGIVRVKEVSAKIDKQGRFRLPLSRNEGSHEIQLEVASVTGGESIETIGLNVVVDLTPPTVEIMPISSPTSSKQLTVRGRSSEKCVVKLGELFVESTDEGSFAIPWTIKTGMNRAELIAIDKAGLRCVRPLIVAKVKELTLSPGDAWPNLLDQTAGPWHIKLEDGVYRQEIEINS
ncbi:MAG: serine/threonine-protein kinase, partial [Planctomycetota bacterium]|nr:serine/threonine-protein kinase [Planctomycetota bacterium]